MQTQKKKAMNQMFRLAVTQWATIPEWREAYINMTINSGLRVPSFVAAIGVAQTAPYYAADPDRVLNQLPNPARIDPELVRFVVTCWLAGLRDYNTGQFTDHVPARLHRYAHQLWNENHV
jgi:hypothetical protein